MFVINYYQCINDIDSLCTLLSIALNRKGAIKLGDFIFIISVSQKIILNQLPHELEQKIANILKSSIHSCATLIANEWNSMSMSCTLNNMKTAQSISNGMYRFSIRDSHIIY